MPTQKPRVTITIEDEILKKIENYQYSNRCKNQTQAILSLIKIGLSSLNKKEFTPQEKINPNIQNKHTQLSNYELNIIANLNKLNETGKQEATKRIEELTYIDKYSENKTIPVQNQEEYIELAARGGKIKIPKK